MADHMTLSHWFICILSLRLVAEVCTRCDNAAFANFVAATSRTNSNWFEFVRLIAATKFCRSDNDFHEINRVTQGDLLRRLVPATYRSDLSPSVSRPLNALRLKYLVCKKHHRGMIHDLFNTIRMAFIVN